MAAQVDIELRMFAQRKDDTVELIRDMIEGRENDRVMRSKLAELQRLDEEYDREVRNVEQDMDVIDVVRDFIRFDRNIMQRFFRIAREVGQRNQELQRRIFHREQERERRAAPGFINEDPSDNMVGGSSRQIERHLRQVRRLRGKGFFDSIYKTVKKAVERAPKIKVETNLANISGQFVTAGYFRSTEAFLKQNGSTVITALAIRRTPVNKLIDTALQMITMGTWEKSKNDLSYDSMFHLTLIVNGNIGIQKLSRISVEPLDPSGPGSEFMDVPVTGAPLTIMQLLDNTLKNVGKEKFFLYDAFDNNCQNFVVDVLRSNNLLGSGLEIRNFVVQPADVLIKKQPDYLATVSRTLTNLGAIFQAYG